MNKKISVAIGKKIISNSENWLNIISPIDESIVGQIPKVSTKKEINIIFKNAFINFNNIKNIPFIERKKKLLLFCEKLEKNKEEIVRLINIEIAKPKKLAIDEVNRSIEYIKETIKEYEKLLKNPIIIDHKIHKIKGKNGIFSYQPLGVILAISPFNYPLNLLVAKLAPALISGNVVVFKPATQGSCIGALISTLLFESGFNQGEVSCIIGKGNEIGKFIYSNKYINMISFTGSTKIGREIARKNPLIPIVLELGGNDSAIILSDVNIKKIIPLITKGAFLYNGQRCTGIKRILVDNKIKDIFIKSLIKEVDKLKIASAKIHDAEITELISKNAYNYNVSLINDAIKKGGKVYTKNNNLNNKILSPTIIFDVPLNAKIVKEEQFGPIIPIIVFNSVEEAIKISNNTSYGLQASIFSSNIKKAKEIATKLEVMTVNINQPPSRGPDQFPFGGIKESGKGLQGIKEAIISMNRLQGIIEND